MIGVFRSPVISSAKSLYQNWVVNAPQCGQLKAASAVDGVTDLLMVGQRGISVTLEVVKPAKLPPRVGPNSSDDRRFVLGPTLKTSLRQLSILEALS